MATTRHSRSRPLFSVVADRAQTGAVDDAVIHIRKGFKWIEVKRYQEALNIKDKAFARIIGVSDRTLTRTKRDKISLDSVASDRLYRMLRVLKLAATVFEDLPRAIQWLQREQPGLNGKVPLSLLDTDPGTQAVEALLRQLEYGVLP